MSRIIKIGGFAHLKTVEIGGNKPVVIQTMWKESLSAADLGSVAKRIETLESLGCNYCVLLYLICNPQKS